MTIISAVNNLVLSHSFYVIQIAKDVSKSYSAFLHDNKSMITNQ